MSQQLIAITLKASHDRKRDFEMFLDNLSTSILRLCDVRKLSYEAASELCDLSSRYFGSIARGQTAPTVITLEKLCNGFSLTPNDLLVVPVKQEEMSYRQPMRISQIRCYRNADTIIGFPICPQCNIPLDREYQQYCDRCGQRLNWDQFSEAAIIFSD